MVSFVPDKDFSVIVVSIDPTEGTELAASKKAHLPEALRPPGDGLGLAFF